MADTLVDLRCGDLFDELPSLEAESVDAGVMDPPYGLGFMGREWDTFKPGVEAARVVVNRAIASENPNLKGRTRGPASSPSAVEYDRSVAGQRAFQDWTAQWAAEVYRVLKPGAHIAVFGAPRSFHRMAAGLEDAGFEIRDTLCWLFGQGFPKSKNLGDGWGTALKPAWEPIVLARKPILGTVIANFATRGTGGLNIDGCRVATAGEVFHVPQSDPSKRRGVVGTDLGISGADVADFQAAQRASIQRTQDLGRWPADVVLSHSPQCQPRIEEDSDEYDIVETIVWQCADDCPIRLLDAQTGTLKSGERKAAHIRRSENERAIYDTGWHGDGTPAYGADIPASSGGASRFFYCAKTSRAEREFGCEGLPLRTAGEVTGGREEDSAGLKNPRAGAGRTSGLRNHHPTVKPVALMRWLTRLVTPVGGIVLDPFMGSGTTGMACRYEGFDFIGVEREAEFMEIALCRVYAVDPANQAA